MPDIAGNSLGTATFINLKSTLQTFQDTVTPAANDYYRFNLSYRSSVNLSLTGLTADANVAILDAAGNPLSLGGTPVASTNSGILADSINTVLDAGVYYIRVSPGPAIASADYALNISLSNNLQTNLVWRNYATGSDGVWFMNGTTRTGVGLVEAIPDLNWAIVGTGDFNNDGQTDLVWRNYANGSNGVWFMNGTTRTGVGLIEAIPDTNWAIVGTGDFNNDGQTDLVWRNYATGSNGVWFMNGTTRTGVGLVEAIPDRNWAIVGTGDFNNDGQTDLVWRNYATGSNGVWFMNGTTRTGVGLIEAIPDTNWVIAGTGDFNNDGQTDLVWRNYATGSEGVWFMNGTTRTGVGLIEAIPDTNWRVLSPFITANPPNPIDGAGDTLATAFNLGTALTGTGTYQDAIGNADINDYYQFNLSTASNVTLSLGSFTSNLDLQLLASNGTVIKTSALSNNTPESIAQTLNAGTYYVRVFPGGLNPTNYTLGVSIDNLPVVVTNTNLTVTEGASVTLTSSVLQATDNDDRLTPLIYTLNSLPTTGTLSLAGSSLTIGSTFTQADLDDGTRLTYLQNGSEALTDSFSFTVSDGRGGVLSGNTFTLQISPVNDPPVVTVPATLSADQGANIGITGVSIADPDAGTGNMTVTLSAVNGVLSLGSKLNLSFAQGDGSQDSAMVFSGPLSAVNTALSTLIYSSNSTFKGTDTIRVTVDDNGNFGAGGSKTDSKSFSVTVSPVNQPPRITLPNTLAVDEDTSLTVAGISISDPDAGGGNMTVSLSVNNGVVSLSSTAGLSFATGTGVQDRNVTFTGTLAVINAALNNLVYRGNLNYNGPDAITISVSDNGNTGNGVPQSDVEVLGLTVRPVNDPPALTVPTAQSANENTDLRIAGISVTDVDAGSGLLTMSLAVGNGTLSLGSTAGLSFTTGTGTQNTSMIFTGTLAALNAALSTLTYRGNLNFNGTDTLNLTVSDNGNTGNGIALSDSRSIALNVLGVNNPPVVLLPPVPSANSGTSIAIPGISVTDPDAGSGNATITLAATNGVLSLTPNTGITFLQGTGTNNSRLTFEGTLTAINTALATLTYQSLPGFVGFDSIAVSVNDEGNTGIGVPLTGTGTLFINVGNAVDIPPIANNDVYSVNRNSILNVPGTGVLTNDSDADGTFLAAVLVAGPNNGTLTLNSGGSFIYTPNPNFVGSDNFTYRASDGITTSGIATVSIAVNSVNVPPIANNDSYTVGSGGTLIPAVGVLVNDTDANGDSLTAVLGTSTTNGSLTLNPNGSFVYTPRVGFVGTDSFTYLANDGTVNSTSPATVSITVVSVNTPPVANNDSYTIAAGKTLTPTIGVLANDTDAENNSLTAVLVATALNGSLSLNSNGSFTYVPNTGFVGVDSFTYRANDGTVNSTNPAVVTLSVTNTAPVAVNDSYSTTRDLGLTIGTGTGVLANDTDAEGNSLTALLSSNPSNGTLSLNGNGSFTYTPSAGFVGTDSFTYRTSDGIATSTLATALITVNPPPNTAPVAVNDSYTVAAGKTLTPTTGVLANDTDAQNNTLTAVLATTAQNGSLSLNPNGTFSYTPNPTFAGTDSFTYQANDGSLNSTNTAIVTLVVTNTAPVAVNDSYSTSQSQSISIASATGVLSNDTDAEGNSLTVVPGTTTSNGTLSLNGNGSFTYTPNANFVGTDSFTYQVSDGIATSTTSATAFITVNTTNTAPVAVNDSYTVAAGKTLTPTTGVLANDTDAQNNTLTAVLATTAQNGSLSLNPNGTFSYTPNATFVGTDSFTYQANDGSLNSTNTAIVTLVVTNTAPVAVNDSYSTSQSQSISIASATGVLSNDTDAEGNSLTVVPGTTTSNGTLSLNGNGSFTYTPNANFVGTDSFTYQVSDGIATSTTSATAFITVNTTNTAPVAVNDSYTVAAGKTLTPTTGVLANDTDAQNNTLTAVLATTALNGSLSLNPNGTFSYTPNATFVGTDSFTYQANDGSLNSTNTAIVTLVVTNTAPVAVNDSYTTVRDQSISIASATGVLSNDTDAEGNSLTVVPGTTTSNGTLSLNTNGSFTYTPNTGFAGTDSFTYQVSDGIATSTTSATAFITVNATNTAPVAVNDSYTLAAGKVATPTPSVLSNDTDAENNSLTAILGTNASNGTVTLNPNGTFSYTPKAGFVGTDSFTYQANDGSLNSTNTAIVTLVVTNTAPVAVNDSYSLAHNQSISIAPATGVLSNDTDAEGNSLTIVPGTSTTNGTLSLNGDGSFTYTPNTGFIGTDTFTYQVSDGIATSPTTATVTLAVTNAAPVAVNDSYTGTRDQSLSIPVAGVLANDTDAEKDPLTATLLAQASNGTVTLNSNGSFVYTPQFGFLGTDSFTYQVSDGNANSSPATVSLTVTAGVNTAPVANNDNYQVAAGITRTVSASLVGLLSNDTDAQSDPLSAFVTSNPANGTLSLKSDGSFTYTPNANFQGIDTFTYQASDGLLNSNTATVTLTVAPNNPPNAVNDSYRMAIGTTLTRDQLSGVLGNDTDPDKNPLTASKVSDPTNGSVTLNSDGSFVYTPTPTFQGTDSFTYLASDGLASSTATVTIAVVPNAAPVANGDSYRVVTGQSFTVGAFNGVLGNDTDADGNTLTAIQQSSPSNGTLTLNGDGSFVYTPNPTFQGTDSFTYLANDGISNSGTATVLLRVAPNTPPVAVNDFYQTQLNRQLTITAPGVLSNDTDAESDPIKLVPFSVTQPANGAILISGSDGSFTYRPNTGFTGTDTFTYQISDGFSNAATLGTVTIAVGNTAPVAVSDSYSVNRNNFLSVSVAKGVLVNDTDAQNDPLTVASNTQPGNGTVTLNGDGSFTYTPTANFAGTDSFTYQVSDGSLSSTGTVTVTVNSTSNPPVANGDTYTVSAGATLSVTAASGVLSNDTDPEQDHLFAQPGTQPGNGTLTLSSDGSFTYTPNASFTNGLDSFTYLASDGINTSPATVTITVGNGGTNAAPVVRVPGGQIVPSGTTLLVPNLSVSDVDAGSNPIVVTLNATTGNLTVNTVPNVTLTGNGTTTVTLQGAIADIDTALSSLQYRPTNNSFTGTDLITVTANDQGFTGAGGAQTGTGTITVSVTAGPTQVADINPGSASSVPNSLAAAGSTLFFAADNGTSGSELWRSDGTSGGTVQVADINAFSSSSPSNFTQVGNTLFFTADDGNTGVELWALNLTGGSPFQVKDINPSIGDALPSNLVNFNGTLFFIATDSNGTAVWKSDGTSAGTVKVGSGYGTASKLTLVGNTLYFQAGTQLWKTDGTNAGTTLIKDLGSTGGIANLTAVGSTLFFTAKDANGTELWRSDGTSTGTVRISDINPGSGSANPTNLVNLNGALYFFASTGSSYGLWKSTEAGVVSQVGSSLTGQVPVTSSTSPTVTVVGSTLYFTLDLSGGNGTNVQLWQSDGTTVSQVKDINPGGNADVRSLTNVNGTLFFTANDGTGEKIWRSDGTSAGTVSVGAAFAQPPSYLTAVGNRLFFAGATTNSTSGLELWVL